MDKRVKEIMNVQIDYREKLNLDENVTMGLEIEYKKIWDKIIKLKINKNGLDKWKNVYDESVAFKIYGQYFGGEINSPILKDNENTWIELKKICQILRDSKCEINSRCGGHIHIGNNILDNNYDNYIKLYKLWYMYEPIIYRFSYGEYQTGRSAIVKYARSMRPFFEPILKGDKNFKDVNQLANYFEIRVTRYYGINFSNIRNDKKTIEFRCPNSSLNHIIWQNNANFFGNFLNCIKDTEIDEEYLNYKLQNNNSNVNDYNNINIEDAIKLSNIVFKDEIDKLYFLRQYIKDGKNNNQFVKSEKFTK